jgi:very-short-patch-repair endonuclease
LAVEIDRDVHEADNVKNFDLERQNLLEKYGITFLRFSNHQIFENLESILQVIRPN